MILTELLGRSTLINQRTGGKFNSDHPADKETLHSAKSCGYTYEESNRIKERSQLQALGLETHAHEKEFSGVRGREVLPCDSESSDSVQSLRARLVIPVSFSYVGGGNVFELRVNPGGTCCRGRNVSFRYYYRTSMDVVPKSSESNRNDNTRETEPSHVFSGQLCATRGAPKRLGRR